MSCTLTYLHILSMLLAQPVHPHVPCIISFLTNCPKAAWNWTSINVDLDVTAKVFKVIDRGSKKLTATLTARSLAELASQDFFSSGGVLASHWNVPKISVFMTQKTSKFISEHSRTKVLSRDDSELRVPFDLVDLHKLLVEDLECLDCWHLADQLFKVKYSII